MSNTISAISSNETQQVDLLLLNADDDGEVSKLNPLNY